MDRPSYCGVSHLVIHRLYARQGFLLHYKESRIGGLTGDSQMCNHWLHHEAGGS